MGYLPTVGLASRDITSRAVALDKNDNMQTISELCHPDEPRLAIILSLILEYEGGGPFQRDKIAKIDAMVGQIDEALVFVPIRILFL